MAAVVATNVAAGSYHDSAGFYHGLFTATSTASDTIDLSAWFENIYFLHAEDVSDGTDAEAFVTDVAYGNGITTTQNKGAIYIRAIGTPIKSSGGTT